MWALFGPLIVRVYFQLLLIYNFHVDANQAATSLTILSIQTFCGEHDDGIESIMGSLFCVDVMELSSDTHRTCYITFTTSPERTQSKC